MYLVKALAVATFPVKYDGPNVVWASGQTAVIEDNMYARFAAHPAVFTILAGPDEADVIRAAEAHDAGETAGAKNGATVTATETTGVVHKTTLTLASLPLTLADATTGAGVKIYDFPEGRILILGATGSIAMTTTSVLASTLNAGVTCNWGVGSTTQANGTLATTEQDILQKSNITASATVNVAGAASNAFGALAAFDGTATALDAYLNVGVATGTDIDGDATVTISGSVTISWMLLGDY